ncbi:hypothetical protein NIES4106_61760 (plasmid) [Fischerella sp. NIES-4106]|nr:hypothetical protein NIES4106_61760 [Fischerella sp. NIES-4106]
MTKPFEDLSGQIFGKLTVKGISHRHKHPSNCISIVWDCFCECGNTVKVFGKDLKKGNTLSCGCFKLTHGLKHGLTNTPTYRCWSDIKTRCSNSKSRNYSNYGGRGITICDRWLSFENFLTDMGEVPNGYSIERIDNSKGYCPNNCKWASKSEQSINRRKQKDTTSRFKGVSLDKGSNRWNTQIVQNYQIYRLGSFDSEVEAAKAYDQKARELGRHELTLNFPNFILSGSNTN